MLRLTVSFPLFVAAMGLTMHLSMGLSTDTSDEEEAFLGLAALNQPAFSDGKVSNQSFVHSDEQGRLTKIEYHVEHAAPFERLENFEGLVDSVCIGANVQLSFTSRDAASQASTRMHPGLLLVLPKRACSGTAVMLRRIVSVTASPVEAVLKIQAEGAGLGDFFKNGDIVFSTAKYPAGTKPSARALTLAQLRVLPYRLLCVFRSSPDSAL
jgi:hypothetical protein